MKTYKVEIPSKTTSSFENAISFKPDYVMSVMTINPPWYWPWGKVIEYGIIGNLRDAEEEALEKAINHAKVMFFKVPCRITETTEVDGHKTNEVIWQNGKALGKTRWDWFYRFTEWLKRVASE